MLTKEQFASLKVGQVVLYNGRPRVIRQVSYHKGRCGPVVFLTFAIKHKSWTKRILTVQMYHQLKDKITLLPKATSQAFSDAIGEIESDVLKGSGFDVVNELKREIARGKNYKRRTGVKQPTDAIKHAIRSLACAIRKKKHNST